MIIKRIFLMAVLFTAMIGCTSDDDGSQNSSQVITGLTEVATSGGWAISSYIDSGNNETTHFTGYTFVFNSNGSITASNGETTVQGTWSITAEDDSNDDNPSSSDAEIHFNISFSTPENFSDLTDDWHLVAYSSNQIQLIDVSGGNGGTDYLTFTK